MIPLVAKTTPDDLRHIIANAILADETLANIKTCREIESHDQKLFNQRANLRHYCYGFSEASLVLAPRPLSSGEEW